MGSGDVIKMRVDENGEIFAKGTQKVYHTGNKPTPADIGAATSSHTHNYAGSSSAGGAANSAVKLATARTINGVSFDGSANITITAAANGGTSAACSGNSATATK